MERAKEIVAAMRDGQGGREVRVGVCGMAASGDSVRGCFQRGRCAAEDQ